jgi:hypothetical protein
METDTNRNGKCRQNFVYSVAARKVCCIEVLEEVKTSRARETGQWKVLYNEELLLYIAPQLALSLRKN